MSTIRGTARTIVTVCVFDLGDAWDMDIISEDIDPWSTLCLLRAAYRRQLDYVESIEYGDDDVDDDE